MTKCSISLEEARRHELGGDLKKDKVVWSTAGTQSRGEREKNIATADMWTEFEKERKKQTKEHADYGTIGAGRIAQKNIDKKSN